MSLVSLLFYQCELLNAYKSQLIRKSEQISGAYLFNRLNRKLNERIHTFWVQEPNKWEQATHSKYFNEQIFRFLFRFFFPSGWKNIRSTFEFEGHHKIHLMRPNAWGNCWKPTVESLQEYKKLGQNRFNFMLCIQSFWSPMHKVHAKRHDTDLVDWKYTNHVAQ